MSVVVVNPVSKKDEGPVKESKLDDDTVFLEMPKTLPQIHRGKP